MNKYAFLGLLTSLLIVLTLTANSISITASVDLTSGIETTTSASVGGVLGLLSTFFKILTFQLTGIPVWFNLIFMVITLMVVYMIIDVVKDLIPFT